MKKKPTNNKIRNKTNKRHCCSTWNGKFPAAISNKRKLAYKFIKVQASNPFKHHLYIEAMKCLFRSLRIESSKYEILKKHTQTKLFNNMYFTQQI